MKINTKIILLAISIISVNANAQFSGFDIYANPQLIEPSLATTFVNRLRNTSIDEMDKLIEGECRQYQNYVYLSIENWDLAKFKHKSFDEAQKYSRQLITQIPYQQSNQYTFPFGIRTYIQSEEILKKAVFERTEPLKQNELVDDMYLKCVQMNNQKYFIILSSDKYVRKDQSIFLSDSELSREFDSSKSFLKLNIIPNESDKITAPNVAQKIKFTEKDFLVANSLINNDIKNSFSSNTIKWIDYRKVSYDMQDSFENFMKNGGRNKNFAQIASIVKYQSLKTDNFKNVEVRNESVLINLFNNNSENLSVEKIKEIMSNFNYK